MVTQPYEPAHLTLFTPDHLVFRGNVTTSTSRSLVRTCPSVHLIGHDSCLPHARLVLENLLGKAGWSPAAMAAEA